MHYVYLIKSDISPSQRYVGYTADLKRRMTDHNQGHSVHTAKHRPWTLQNYFAFQEKHAALAFEEYLKSASGRAFAAKRFWR